ncbi:MAG: hypothetical protein MUC97_10210 [Bernardetiaceae bacterium]|jgi:hypothetical protein|nr:hypothetical protein [Bernardetiaceae bacterium]
MLEVKPRPALLRALLVINLGLWLGAVYALVAFNARPALGWGLAGVLGLVAGLLLSVRLASRYQTLRLQAQTGQVRPWPFGRPWPLAVSQLLRWHELVLNPAARQPYREIKLWVKHRSQTKILIISSLEYKNYDQLRTWLRQSKVPEA